MSTFKILDCTLRDGGYINNWNFGYTTIKNMLKRLSNARIDIIECGFLEDGQYDKNKSLFTDVDQIAQLLPENKEATEFVAMTRYGCLDINNLKDYDGRSINGIRVTFHENEAEDAIKYCRYVKEKGYKVYVQPVGTTGYTDKYLLSIIELVNKLKPFAFYIVDTLGLMKKNDLLRIFYLIDKNLDPETIIGFHSHNNLQLSFSNAQELVDLHTRRSIILDSSVHGMGRGAGNLNTELIAQYLNDVRGHNYQISSILEIIDETINGLKVKYSWGYSVPYYLAAINNCHPNYATYLMNRGTLSIKSIGQILQSIPHDRRELYHEDYIQELYIQYQKHKIDDSNDIAELTTALKEKNILVLAPGNSLKKQAEIIKKFVAEKNPVVISVNFVGNEIKSDYCFFSNNKRFERLQEKHEIENSPKLIITSNIKSNVQVHYKINYSDLLNSQPLVNDNATLMLLALLIKLNVKDVYIAGFDGFQVNVTNYADDQLESDLDANVLKEKNKQITEVVKKYKSLINLNFITESMYNV